MVRLRGLAVTPAAMAALLAAGLVNTTVKAAGLTAAPTSVAERVGGDDRYLTAIEISKRLANGADYVLLASGENFPDALAASPASFTDGNAYAPILLTPKNELRPDVKAEIDRRLDPGDDVWLLGGPAALANSIDAELTAAGYVARRLSSTVGSGPPVDRFDTAAAIATQFVPGPQVEEVILATGLRFPDALAVSAYAAANRVPVLLVTADTIPPATQKYLDDHTAAGTRVSVIGGALAAKSPTAPAGLAIERISGPDRFATGREVVRQLLGRNFSSAKPDDTLILARADDPGGFADALAGGPLAAAAEAPLLLTNPTALPATTSTFVANLGYDQPIRPAKSFVLGKAGAVSDAVVTEWSEILNGVRAVPGRSSTRRSTASAGTVTSSNVDARGCNNGTANKATSFTYKDIKIAGDTPGTLTLTGVVACDVVSGEAATILPGGTVAFTPTGGAAAAGLILGGQMGKLVSTTTNPLPLPLPLPGGETVVTRPVAVTFALPGVSTVGHLTFVDTGVVTNGLMAVVTGATVLPLSGVFASFPNSGCATIAFDGTLGDTAFTVNNLSACRINATSDVWRIGTGAVGGQFAGEVVGGARRGDVVYLAMRTVLGLLDVSIKLDSTLTATPSQSPAFIQALPETDTTVSFEATAPAADNTGTGGCASLRTARDLTQGEVQTGFGGTLRVADLRECRTDTGVGVIEPVLGAVDPANKSARPVCYSHGADCTFRGRIFGGMFSEVGDRTIGLTLLIEENNRNGGNDADRPGTTLTVIRFVTTVPVGAAATTPEGPVGFAR